MEAIEQEVDAAEATVEKAYAGITNHIFGEGEEGIVQRMRESEANIAEAVGTIAFAYVSETIRQGESSGMELGQDELLGIATLVIDNLLQLAESYDLIPSADDDKLRNESMKVAMEAYVMSAEDGENSPEEREAARQMLEQMANEGLVDEAARTIGAMGEEQGIDPFADDPPAPAPGVQSAAVDATTGGGQPAPQQGGAGPLIGG